MPGLIRLVYFHRVAAIHRDEYSGYEGLLARICDPKLTGARLRSSEWQLFPGHSHGTRKQETATGSFRNDVASSASHRLLQTALLTKAVN